MIKIEHLTKKFKENVVLDDINMVWEAGNIYGLVGRNGSGKTMLMKCVCGFVMPTSGTVTVKGQIVGKDIDIPDNMGIIIENPGFLPNYSGFKNLQLLAMIQNKIGKKEIEEILKKVGLDPANKKHLSAYSLGMRQRLGIAQALMENPEILLLDEPMNGLDNEGVEEVRQLLLELKTEGKLIVIASHTKEDISLLCDTVFYMDHGKIVDKREKEVLPS